MTARIVKEFFMFSLEVEADAQQEALGVHVEAEALPVVFLVQITITQDAR